MGLIGTPPRVFSGRCGELQEREEVRRVPLPPLEELAGAVTGAAGGSGAMAVVSAPDPLLPLPVVQSLFMRCSGLSDDMPHAPPPPAVLAPPRNGEVRKDGGLDSSSAAGETRVYARAGKEQGNAKAKLPLSETNKGTKNTTLSQKKKRKRLLRFRCPRMI